MAEDKDKGRKLRPKERRIYSDLDIDEDDIEGRRTFSLEEKLNSTKYSKSYVKELTSADVNLKYFQENGFTSPIFIKEKSGLGMRMPSENFTVSDVKSGVGSRRVLDVMDVTTQKAMEMSMKEWAKYYENQQKDRLLNVISLEFSHTKLDNYVEQPAVVRQLDWVDNVWPQHLKECQTESTNIIQRMKYPKVQKYCLMSVRGCYTDFHIDMSGTSVWYHILRGAKVFWVIPPTDQNLELYENWTLSGKQGDMFFADQVEGCQRINLAAGNTFFIPTGWIHAVYTPVDSLVFGGNFLHSLNIPMQLRIWEVEEKTRVPHKFRYPFFQEIHWYLLDRYLTCVADKSYRDKSADELQEEKENKIKTESAGESADDKGETGPGSSMEEHSLDRSPLEEHSYVCSPKAESPQSPSFFQAGSPKAQDNGEGAKLDEGARNYVNPSDLIKPVSVKLENCLLMQGKGGNSQTPRSYVPLNTYEMEGLIKAIEWLHKIPVTKKQIPKEITDPEALIADAEVMLREHSSDEQKVACSGENFLAWPPRPPELPNSAICALCGTDERDEEAESGLVTKLMECGICWQIVHPECLLKNLPEEVQEEGNVNEDLPNSWECPKCCHAGKQGMLKPRSMKPITKKDRTSASSSDDDVRTDDDGPQRGCPPTNRDKGDSSDTSQAANRRPRGRPLKNRGDEAKGTPTKKLKRDDGGGEQGNGRGPHRSSWQVRNESISNVKEQVDEGVPGIPSDPVVMNGNSQLLVNGDHKLPLKRESIIKTRGDYKVMNGGSTSVPTMDSILLTLNGVEKRKPVVVMKQIDCSTFSGSDKPLKVKKLLNGDSKLMNGDDKHASGLDEPSRSKTRSVSVDSKSSKSDVKKVVNGNSVAVNGKPRKVVISNSPKRNSSLKDRRSMVVRGKSGSFKLNEETKLFLRGKFAQPVVVLERTKSQPMSVRGSIRNKGIPSLASPVKKFTPTRLMSSPKLVKKPCIVVSPDNRPGMVGVSARSGRSIVRPSRFFD